MSVLAQRSFTRFVHANSFDLNGQLCISKLFVERHLSEYLRSVGFRPGEVKTKLQEIFTQVSQQNWTGCFTVVSPTDFLGIFNSWRPLHH